MAPYPVFVPYLVPAAAFGIAAMRMAARMRAQRAADEAVTSWGARRGYTPAEPPLGGSTPTLNLPDGAARDAWQVPVGELGATLFQWTWTVAREGGMLATEMGMSSGLSGMALQADRTIGRATVVEATLAAGFPHFRVVPRHHYTMPPAPGWGEEEVQLESVEFCDRFRLLAGRDGDREALLRLFDPETIVWIVEQGAAMPVIEYGLGTLAVVSLQECTTDAELDALVADAQRFAGRVLAEGMLHRPGAAA